MTADRITTSFVEHVSFTLLTYLVTALSELHLVFVLAAFWANKI
jgi:hypothetical protein